MVGKQVRAQGGGGEGASQLGQHVEATSWSLERRARAVTHTRGNVERSTTAMSERCVNAGLLSPVAVKARAQKADWEGGERCLGLEKDRSWGLRAAQQRE